MQVNTTIMLHFPDVNNANNLKIFQNPTSQIRGFYFTKSQLSKVEELDYANNHAVYFLFSEIEEASVYVGQSVKGIGRIKSHLKKKDFWQFGILFVTDNHSFDKLSIDFLEYYFIQAFAKTQYSLENQDLRPTQPNVNIFNLSTLEAFASQIQFLLEAMGISFQPTLQPTEDLIELESFKARSPFDAALRLQDGKYVLLIGSIIHKPLDRTKDRSDRVNFYQRYKRRYFQLIDSGKAQAIDDKTARLLEDIEFTSPSTPAALCSGRSQNGWVFWEGLNEKRQNEQ